MRFVKLSQSEIESILKLYEGIMSYACHGILFREGEVIAEGLAELCKDKEDFLEHAKKLLIARGWVEDIVFSETEIKVKGSIEVMNGSESVTCHRLRGILSRLYSLYNKKYIRFVEDTCCSTGSSECTFKKEVS